LHPSKARGSGGFTKNFFDDDVSTLFGVVVVVVVVKKRDDDVKNAPPPRHHLLPKKAAFFEDLDANKDANMFTCCAGFFFPILDFSLSIHSRLKKEAETKSGFSPRERRRRSRLLCTTRRESSSSLYTRFPKSSCFCAHHRRSRGVVRNEAALFGTRASILRVFLFAFKRTREREETFFFFESPHKKVYSKISR